MSSSAAWLLALLCLAVPLAADPAGYLPFLPPKEATLAVGGALVAVALAASLLARAWGPAAAAATDGATRRRARLLPLPLAALVLFWAWSVAAPLPAASPELHLQGALRLSALTAVALAAAVAAASDPRWRTRLVATLAVSGAIVAIHALLQAVAQDPWAWIGFAPDHGIEGRWRVFTTTGNPNWTGAYLAITAPLAAWCAFRATTRAAARFGGAPVSIHLVVQLGVWIILLAAILATGSRAALLALVAAATTLGLVAHASGLRTGHAVKGALLTTVTSVIVLRGPAADLLARWDEAGSVQGRLVHYAAALRGIAERPIAGHGLDGFAVTLGRVMPDVALALGPGKSLWLPATPLVHVPNELVETALGAGVVAALLVVVVWAAAAGEAFRAVRRRSGTGSGVRDVPLEGALGATLAALAVLSLVWAPLRNPVAALPFWVTVGLLAVRVDEAEGSAGRTGLMPRNFLTLRVAAIMALLASLALAWFTMERSARWIHGNQESAEARWMLAERRLNSAEELFRSALVRNPADHGSAVFLAGLLLERGRPELAVETLDRADGVGTSLESWLLRADAMAEMGDLDGSLDLADRAVLVYPRSLRAHYALAYIHDRRGDIELAVAAYERVLELPPYPPAPDVWRERAANRLAPLRPETLRPGQPEPGSAGRPSSAASRAVGSDGSPGT